MTEVTEDELLRRSVMRFAMARFERLAGEVTKQMQAYPASGIFGDDVRLDSLWDEYCHDQQHGPASALESAWSQTIAPHVDQVIAAMDRTEAVLLTFYRCWDAQLDPLEVVGNPPEGIDEAELATAITNELVRIALDHELPHYERLDDDEDSEDDTQPED